MNTLQKFRYLLFCFALITFEASAQDNSTEIQQLFAQRAALAAQNQSYSEVEKSIVNLGQIPPALVDFSDINGKKTFSLTTYKNIRPESENQIEGRILISVNHVESVQINNRNIIIVFSQAAEDSDINEFFRLMGYDSYEIKLN